MKRKKIKFFIGLSIIILLLVPYFTFASSSSMSIEVSDSAESGDTLTVVIKVKGSSSGVTALQGKIEYDEDILEYQKYSIIKDGWFVSGFNTSTGIFLAEVGDITDSDSFIKTSEEEILSLKFTVKDDADATNTTITISNIVLAGGDSLEASTISSAIAINGGSSSSVGTTVTATSGSSSSYSSSDESNTISINTTTSSSSGSSNTSSSGSNSSSSDTSSSSSLASSSSSTSSSTTTSGTTSSNSSTNESSSIPYTGSIDIKPIILVILIICIILGLKYYKLKDIK